MKLLVPIVVLLILLVPMLVLSQQPKDCRTDSDCPPDQFCNQTVFQCQPKQDVQTTPGSGIIVPPTESPETTESTIVVPPKQDCADSDGENVFTKGIVTSGSNNFQDFCIDNQIVNEYVCEYDTPNYKDIKCPEKSRCFDGKCEEELKVVLETDPRVFGPRVSDPKVSKDGKEPWVGNNRPKELNPDNGVLSNLDPWVCRIELFNSDQNINSIAFSIIDSHMYTWYKGVATRKPEFGSNVFEGVIPRESVNRGEEVSCVISSDGQEYQSDPVKIAKILFILVDNPDYQGKYLENFDQQFAFFLKRTYLEQGDYKLIKTERDVCRGIEGGPSFFSKSVNPLKCLKSLGELWINKDVIINAAPDDIGGSHLNINTGYVVVTNRVGGIYTAEETDFYNAHYPNSIITLAHELGHRFGLSDEYAYDIYKREVKGLGHSNDYATCCYDYDEMDNPYYTLVISTNAFGYQNTEVNCSLDLGGRCIPVESHFKATYCPEDETFLFGGFDVTITTCRGSTKCCFNKIKVGNNCYPPSFGPLKSFKPYGPNVGCAGMPLNQDGSQAVVNEQIEEGKRSKMNIEADYRSIMGATLKLLSFEFPQENLVYPNTNNLQWPLKPGIPKAG